MSFSGETKQEIGKLPLEKECCLIAELNALTQCLGALSLHGGGRIQLKYVTESIVVARRLLVLLKKGLHVQVRTGIRKENRFGGRLVTTLSLSAEDSRHLLRRLNVLKQDEQGEDVFQGVPRRIVRRICCRRSFLRGMFLGCGTVISPEKGYHAEFLVEDEQRARFLIRVLALCDIEASLSFRREKAVVYMKNGEIVARLLATLGANRAVLKTEEVRTLQSVKKQVTRAMNCDHANMGKQLSAAEKQLSAITRISKLIGLSALPDELQALARMRISHQEASLEQLGQLMEPPVSKSGVQHRMKRLTDMAAGLSIPIPTNTVQEET